MPQIGLNKWNSRQKWSISEMHSMQLLVQRSQMQKESKKQQRVLSRVHYALRIMPPTGLNRVRRVKAASLHSPSATD